MIVRQLLTGDSSKLSICHVSAQNLTWSSLGTNFMLFFGCLSRACVGGVSRYLKGLYRNSVFRACWGCHEEIKTTHRIIQIKMQKWLCLFWLHVWPSNCLAFLKILCLYFSPTVLYITSTFTPSI